MSAKVQILDKQINSFGGIFYVISQFRSSSQAALIDRRWWSSTTSEARRGNRRQWHLQLFTSRPYDRLRL